MHTPNDPFDLARFVEVQDESLHRVHAELEAGRKTSHWIWFIFPQLAGLGASLIAQAYSIASRAEAEAYLAHPQLGPRLRECVALATAIPGRTANQVFGFPDDLKFRSCLTLFNAIAPNDPVFRAALDRFYEGERDPRTLELLAQM